MKTKVLPLAGKFPIWNETLTLILDSIMDPNLPVTLTCFDEDLIKDDLVGKCEVPLKMLCVDKDHVLNLLFKNTVAGKLYLTTKYIEH